MNPHRGCDPRGSSCYVGDLRHHLQVGGADLVVVELVLELVSASHGIVQLFDRQGITSADRYSAYVRCIHV